MTFWPRRADEKLIGSTSVLPSFAVKRRLTNPLLGHTGSLAWVTSSIPHNVPYDTRVTYSATRAGGGNVWAIANVLRVACVCIHVHAHNARRYVTIGGKDMYTRPEHHSLSRNYPV